MSWRHPVTIIGSGCAGLSLAKEIGAQKLGAVNLVTDRSCHERAPHMWGFWQMPWLEDAAGRSDHQWQNWQIITDDTTITHHSIAHPYHQISSDKWLSYCLAQSGTTETITPSAMPADPYFDSRPLAPPQACLYQHFAGQHIVTDEDVFDPKTALLMDFRCDQSQGLHFIYLLPSSPRHALIESTLFTDTPLDKSYYHDAITSYMARHYQGVSYQITGEEAGIIPLADCRDKQAPAHAIGARGGALRPSSGYAFTFIQKQVNAIINHYKKTGTWRAQSPIPARDLWMDKVFLHVLKTHPERAISLFAAMAQALRGDEFARFMSGTPSWASLAKVILAMPKAPFLVAACAVLVGRG